MCHRYIYKEAAEKCIGETKMKSQKITTYIGVMSVVWRVIAAGQRSKGSEKTGSKQIQKKGLHIEASKPASVCQPGRYMLRSVRLRRMYWPEHGQSFTRPRKLNDLAIADHFWDFLLM